LKLFFNRYQGQVRLTLLETSTRIFDYPSRFTTRNKRSI